MELQKQVVSLEFAKRLKKLGVKQESMFSYHQKGSYFLGQERIEELLPTIELTKYCHNDFPYKTLCSAFTVAELGMMLPRYDMYYAYSFHGNNPDSEWSCVYLFATSGEIKHQVWADTEADARAKMLIYLLENNLITLNEVNK